MSINSLYVDDMIIPFSTEGEMKSIVKQVNEHTDADNHGPITFYLVMKIERDGARGAIKIHKRNAELDNSKPASTPWASGTILNKCKAENCELKLKEYQRLNDCLLYLAVKSRPDITHVVSRLSQYNSHPHEEHLKAAKHVLRYLNKHPSGKITYSKSG